MKFLQATFKNYIGFFNGMGLYDIHIDFTKCKHNIILISGMNGSGKSTLLFHLNPFPDGSSSFIPNKSAEKDLVLEANGDTYSIQIFSPYDDIKDVRKTTKAYIQKNGIELNENGNVSSYKDIIFSEFELDSNYVSLSRLSSTDRGLGDKTPAERKKFASNIIDNLEIYNNMYKTLNKKSLIYKSHINTLHTKIQNIGSKEILDTRLRSLRAKEQELNNLIMNKNNQIVAIQAKNSIDEDEAKEIQSASDTANTLKGELDSYETRLDNFFNRTKISREDIEAKYESEKELVSNYQSKVTELSGIWREKSARLADVSSSIVGIEADLSSSITEDNIADRYNENKKNIEKYRTAIEGTLGVPKFDTRETYNLMNEVISFSTEFVKIIDRLYDNSTSEDMEYIVNLDGKHKTLQQLMNDQSIIMGKIAKEREELAAIQEQVKIIGILENRPKACKIDSCPFIAESIELKKSIKGDIIDKLSDKQMDMTMLSDTLGEIQTEIDYMNSLSSKVILFGTLRDMISNKTHIIDAFFHSYSDKMYVMLNNMSSFGDIRDTSKFIEVLNMVKILEELENDDKVLEVEYKSYRDKVKLINSSKAMLKKLKDEEQDLVQSTADIKKELDEYNRTLQSLSDSIGILYQYKSTYSDYKDKESEYKIAQSKVDDFNKKSSKALEALSSINTLKEEIDKISIELRPITSDISTISGQLTLLDSYYIEYNEYKSSFDIIETLKKYCSPTGGGIQTLFMQLYMSKTKQLANEVLGMLFNGVYQLQDFIINETEFRIPFIGEGLPVDDISSGSASQIAMMSLVINLVLLHQASTKFNIAFLDEIESALDGYNRSNFVNVLFHSINILGIEQLFLISHSIEVDNTFADIIKLKGYENFDSIVNTGNVIWDYNDIAQTLE